VVFFYAFAVEGAKPAEKKDDGGKKKKKSKDPLAENEILKWNFQQEALSECRREGNIIEWFETVVAELINRIKDEAEPAEES